ncbi:MAG: cob(I)yrinic acid a,c-diamide adenosyltransferase [Gammaproteobacteria bacterium]|nr:cob(I)yrinic acid a,c-diamide adenosyltransferase [Gammaproteobacteria bacterium]
MSDAARHKAEMQKLQAEQKQKTIQARDPDRGLVLVYTGEGKGKSTSAFGVIIRALGWGKSVGVVQFIKGKWITGERKFFGKLGRVHWHTMGDGFTWDTQDKERDIEAAEAAFSKACEMMVSGDYDLVVLDEINIAMRYEYLSVDSVISGLEKRSTRTSVILTGRDARPKLCNYADLVSEMRGIKHPFESGIKAQPGLDY